MRSRRSAFLSLGAKMPSDRFDDPRGCSMLPPPCRVAFCRQKDAPRARRSSSVRTTACILNMRKMRLQVDQGSMVMQEWGSNMTLGGLFGRMSSIAGRIGMGPAGRWRPDVGRRPVSRHTRNRDIDFDIRTNGMSCGTVRRQVARLDRYPLSSRLLSLAIRVHCTEPRKLLGRPFAGVPSWRRIGALYGQYHLW